MTTIFKTAQDGALRVPVPRDGANFGAICGDREPRRDGGWWVCNRAHDHRGRHASIRRMLGGRVRAVWGDDVHRLARQARNRPHDVMAEHGDGAPY